VTERASWFTAKRLGRLDSILVGLEGRAPGFALANAQSILWPTCGGPRTEIDELLNVLTRSGLAQVQSSRVFRTRQGQRLVEMGAERRRCELALLLIRRGWYHDQIRLFLRVASHDAGRLVASRSEATAIAPQLVGTLRPLEDDPTAPILAISGSLVADLDSPWTLIPSVMPGAPDARVTVGKRGEAYSFQFLRAQAANRDKILWVAADDETLGHDIEDHGVDPIHRIEVKASADTRVRFILSSNEFRRSREHGAQYTVHFWGGINLHRDPAREYEAMIDAGYPVVFPHLAHAIESGDLVAEPRDWLVTEPACR
jgi:hypothetical protein